LYAFLQKPVYQANGSLLFKRVSTAAQVTGLGQSIGELEPLYKDGIPLDTKAETLRSLPIVQKTIERLKLKDENNEPLIPQDFVSNLVIKQASASDILNITFNDTDPQVAAKVVNTIMYVYLADDIDINRKETKAAREFLEVQLAQTQRKLNQAERALRLFKEQNQVINLPKESEAAVEKISALQQQITDAQAGALKSKTQAQNLVNQLGLNSRDAVALTTASQSVGVQDSLKELQLTESRLAIARSSLSENHPEVAKLEEQRRSLRVLLGQRLNQAVGNSLQSQTSNIQLGALQQNATAQIITLQSEGLALENQSIAISKILQNYLRRVSALPRLEQQQSELESTLSASRQSYNTLFQKLQNSRVTENQDSGNARIVSLATVPIIPVAPRKSLYLVAGVLLGSLLGFGTALILDSRRKSIRSFEDTIGLFEYPILGIIPDLKNTQKFYGSKSELGKAVPENIVKDFPNSPVSQIYWAIRSTLRSLVSEQEPKVIAITSAVSDEGKSTVASNLASSYAQAGLKVLLVDTNWHKPRQYQIWKLENNGSPAENNGVLAHVSSYQNYIDAKQTVESIDINLELLQLENLSPSLFESQQVGMIIKDFSKIYDRIIIDTPSFLFAPTALNLDSAVDGYILISRPDYLDYATAITAKKVLAAEIDHSILGVIVNGLEFGKELNLDSGSNWNNSDKTEQYNSKLSQESYEKV
jgi:capsular exopolysaccharide synthesis family protein